MNKNLVEGAKLLVSGSLMVGLVGCSKVGETSWEKSQKKSVSGTITIRSDLASKVAATDVLFIMAKGESGPPIAVKKITQLHFPMKFTLDEDDLMLPGMVFPEKVFVIARVDKDGNASPAQPGDMDGQSPQNPVVVGNTAVDVEINHVY